MTLEHGTERAFTGKTVNGYTHDNKQRGTYVCALGGLPLFSSVRSGERREAAIRGLGSDADACQHWAGLWGSGAGHVAGLGGKGMGMCSPQTQIVELLTSILPSFQLSRLTGHQV